jgi:hypothetical protein
MADESYIQVATDGSGKKVRNLRVTREVYNTATGGWDLETVYMQAVAVEDEHGSQLSLTATDGLLQQILDELKTIRLCTEAAVTQH